MEQLNRIGHDIIGCAFEVRRTCGKYLLESFYEAALAYELRQLGHQVVLQQRLPAIYKGVEIKDSFVMDIVVDDKVVIECKAVSHLSGVEVKQLYTYLYLSRFKLGYLINFDADDFSPCVWKNNLNNDKGIIRIIR